MEVRPILFRRFQPLFFLGVSAFSVLLYKSFTIHPQRPDYDEALKSIKKAYDQPVSQLVANELIYSVYSTVWLLEKNF